MTPALLMLHGTLAAVAPGVLSTEQAHEAPSGFLPGGLLVVTRSAADFSSSHLLTWDPAQPDQAPRPLPFSAPGHRDAGGGWDGAWLYFTSARPGAAEDDWNLWRVSFDGFRWGEPEPLPTPINTDAAECCVVVVGDSLYFSSDRAGSWDIHRVPLARLGSESPQPVAALNSEHGEWPSFVDPASGLLLMSSIRPGGPGGDDLWVSVAGAQGWGAPRRLPSPVNGPGYQDSALVSPDGRTLWFSSRRDGAKADVFRLPLEDALEGSSRE